MHQPDFLFGLAPGDLIYDVETYPNIFTIGLMHAQTHRRWLFEISTRRNDLHRLCRFLELARDHHCRMVGFNNIGFDYPVIHHIYKNEIVHIGESDIYDKAMSIIKAPHHARFANMVWESDRVVPQLDLYKIHHFDNPAKATSLKVLEFNMRMGSIEDLPFDVGIHLDNEQMDVLIDYMWHDIRATFDFYMESKDMITFRESLTAQYGKNFVNFNDTKIGSEIFIHQLEGAGIPCFERDANNKKKPRQTKRPEIRLADVILPYIQFERPEFQRILDWFKAQTIQETKGVFKEINCTIDGVQYDFGTGGLHAAVSDKAYFSDKHNVVELRDVASYYPNLAIKNKFYPKHLGEGFCEIYEGLYNQRKSHAKGTAENAALKLALNGTYGNSNNEYSPFYDPQFTMAITINGQLLLCFLIEKLLKTPGLELIAANTDGIAYRCPKGHLPYVNAVCDWWMRVTQLELETDHIDQYFSKDVNNYAMVHTDGKVKRKGKFEYKLGWHQNHSALIVPKAAEAALVHGADIREFITNHTDMFDFFLRAKVPRSNTLEWGGIQVNNIERYYISNDGRPLEKVAPPKGPVGQYKRANKLTDAFYDSVMEEIGPGVWDERIHTKNKSTYDTVRTGIHTGWTVALCSDMDNLLQAPDGGTPMLDLNYEWYIAETEKLVKPIVD